MSRLQSLARLAAPLALAAMTAACAPTFNAKVNRFQAMPAPQGESFAILAADPKLAGSLEFDQYARLVSQKLTAQGYQPAASSAVASLLVRVSYGVDEGKERVRSTGFGYGGYGGYGRFGYYDPFYSPYYGRYGGYYGRSRAAFAFGYYDPFLFGPGYGDELESYTVYTSGLDMKIERKADGQRLFEGKAQAQSLNNNLTYLVPNLVEAMFTGFPGNSGETVKITVQQPKKK
jgi:Domain of unknown function (DUF4136)